MPTIRMMMLDLYSARCAKWENEGIAYSYQDLWFAIRQTLGQVYQQILGGLEIEDNMLTICMHGTPVARFEIK